MEKVGIMQPYFLPYYGYFSLIKHVDRFIILDAVQHIRHGWVDRNRILKQTEGWLYIRPDLKKFSHGDLISDIQIDNATNWKSKILSQLVVYKGIAPHYWKTRKFLESVLECEHCDLVRQNKFLLEEICKYLGFEKRIELFSEMNLAIDGPRAPDEWALNICKALGDVSEYWNPPGGQEFFDANKYARENISLKFQIPKPAIYKQRQDQEFISSLSIVDMLMFNDIAESNTMIDGFELI